MYEKVTKYLQNVGQLIQKSQRIHNQAGKAPQGHITFGLLSL